MSGQPPNSPDQKLPKIRFDTISSLTDDLAKKYAFEVDRKPVYLTSSDAHGTDMVCFKNTTNSCMRVD